MQSTRRCHEVLMISVKFCSMIRPTLAELHDHGFPWTFNKRPWKAMVIQLTTTF